MKRSWDMESEDALSHRDKCLYGHVRLHGQVSPSKELIIYLSYSSRDVKRISEIMQVKATTGEFKNSSYYVKENNVVYVKHWFGN